jgi:hypothetical protein
MRSRNQIIHITLYCFFVILSAFAVSCSTSTPVSTTPKSNEELLAGSTSKIWELVSRTNAVGINAPSSDWSSYTFEYRRDGTFQQIVVSKTAGVAPVIVNATWKLTGNQITTITGSGSSTASTVQVVDELTETSLKLSYADPRNQGKIVLKSR